VKKWNFEEPSHHSHMEYVLSPHVDGHKQTHICKYSGLRHITHSCIHSYSQIQIHSYAQMHTHTHILMHTHKYAYSQIHIHSYAHIDTHAPTFLCTHTHSCTRRYDHRCICIQILTHKTYNTCITECSLAVWKHRSASSFLGLRENETRYKINPTWLLDIINDQPLGKSEVG
jgi:hypothetical protein